MGKIRLIFILFIIVLTSSQVCAETVTWNDIVGGGLWNTPENWTPSKVPVTGDDVVINSTVTGIISVDAAANIKTLRLGGANKVVLSSHTVTITSAPAPGSLDTAGFNAAGTPPGMVTTDADSDTHESAAYAVAIQSNGQIVAAGYTYNGGHPHFAAARYNTNGTLDTAGFNHLGTVPGVADTRIGNGSQANAVAIQADQKIVIAGWSSSGTAPYPTSFALARYNTDGTLDAAGFNPAGAGGAAPGTVITTIGAGGDDEIAAVAIQKIEGVEKIVVAGYSNNGSRPIFAVARYNLDGTLDNTFGSGGIFTYNFGNWSKIQAMAIQPADQKIVLAGWTSMGPYGIAVMRLTPNGILDTDTFNAADIGHPGIATALIDSNETKPYSLALQGDGKIVVAGYTYFDSLFHFAVARFTADGVLDADNFNKDGSTPGTVTTPIGTSEEQAYAVAIQKDGKIVAAGYAYAGAPYEFALLRYNSDGSLDTTFGTGGKVTTEVGTGSVSRAYGLAIQGDGKIVAAGQSHGGGVYYFAVVRYWP